MAQRAVTIYTDDLTGEEGDDIAAHTFSVDGISYEIDLSPDSYQKLLDALGLFVGAGRKTSRGTRRRAGKQDQAAVGPDPVKVREWARSQGIEVNTRGRVPRVVIEKYQSAH
jgi:hypothetical protein